MNYIDVFNGDADGLCALVQLRRNEPLDSQIITGIKRDINLLKQVDDGTNSYITVLDISFEKNVSDVERLLEHGASIDYIDHHKTGELIQHPKLQLSIDLNADTCTSLIIDKRLRGKYRAWAITAAYGDNLVEKATKLGRKSGFSDNELLIMKALGLLLNYNGYGANIDDLFFNPVDLFEKVRQFDTPFEFLEQEKATYKALEEGYQQDIILAEQAPVIHETADTAVIELPNEVWARRVSGVFANDLANKYPDRAHAVITKKIDGSYVVSVRAPLNRKTGADELVSQFPTGGGRKASAGINSLSVEILEQFFAAFDTQFKS